jgi:hypothetical protein
MARAAGAKDRRSLIASTGAVVDVLDFVLKKDQRMHRHPCDRQPGGVPVSLSSRGRGADAIGRIEDGDERVTALPRLVTGASSRTV